MLSAPLTGIKITGEINKVLVTGTAGFIGGYLANYVADIPEGQALGLAKWCAPKDNTMHILDEITLEFDDLSDLSSLEHTSVLFPFSLQAKLKILLFTALSLSQIISNFYQKISK